MKKLLVLAMAAFLVSGSVSAFNGGDKGKGKTKKHATAHNCPGKECNKKKG